VTTGGKKVSRAGEKNVGITYNEGRGKKWEVRGEKEMRGTEKPRESQGVFIKGGLGEKNDRVGRVKGKEIGGRSNIKGMGGNTLRFE